MIESATWLSFRVLHDVQMPVHVCARLCMNIRGRGCCSTVSRSLTSAICVLMTHGVTVLFRSQHHVVFEMISDQLEKRHMATCTKLIRTAQEIDQGSGLGFSKLTMPCIRVHNCMLHVF